MFSGEQVCDGYDRQLLHGLYRTGKKYKFVQVDIFNWHFVSFFIYSCFFFQPAGMNEQISMEVCVVSDMS
jgi:hypothetical protein